MLDYLLLKLPNAQGLVPATLSTMCGELQSKLTVSLDSNNLKNGFCLRTVLLDGCFFHLFFFTVDDQYFISNPI